MKKAFLFFSLIFIPLGTYANEIICREDTVLHTGCNASGRRHNDGQTYRIKADSLFIVRADKSEYFYGALVKTGYRRYVVGYKYLVFHNDDSKRLTVPHIDDLETRIICLHCLGESGE